jgi:hypothetical protein
MRTSIISALIIASCSPALAGWQTETFTDPLTDRKHVAASLDPTSGAGQLQVHCINGKPMADFTFSGIVGFGDVGTSYRFDDGPVTMRFAKIFNDGRVIHPWILDSRDAVLKLSKAKRFRIQISPIGQPVIFLDFDMTGASDAISKVKC